MKTLNFGSLNYDYVYTVSHILRPGETITSTSRETFFGGKGFNQSVALAKAGVNVYHAGMVGEDGQAFLDACKEWGINADHIQKIPGESGHTVIQVDESGQNCILLYPGSNRKLTKEYIDQVLSNFSAGDMIILQNEVNHLDYIIDSAFARGMEIVLNPSPYDALIEQCDLSKISYFLVNEIEGEQITGKSNPEDILNYMLEKYPNAKIVLTLGGDGSVYADSKMRCHQDIFKVKAVDTTAAGDTFTGYFISGIQKGKSVPNALRLAAKASSITVSGKGAAPSIPLYAEVEKQLGDV